MSSPSHQKLIDALDLHENLLHAEHQAIRARDLNTVEDLLMQKDSSLELLLLAKQNLGSDFSPEVRNRINNVLSQQKKNTENFRRLHVQGESSPNNQDSCNPLFKRMKQAYSN